MSAEPAPIAGTATRLLVERADDHVDIGLVGELEDPSTAPEVAAAVLAATDGDPSQVWLRADHPPDHLHPLPGAVADRLGLDGRRELLQMRRPLPVPEDHPTRRHGSLRFRSFEPGVDDAPWVRANNRAFATHPDQGTQTLASLGATLAEPWVDLAGFLVLDDPHRPGELAGSCWTRVHPATATDPELGEIFVIGVDPACQGQGLGPALVLAGLDHLAARQVTVGMLYVESTNAPARRTYERLGFDVHLRRTLAYRQSGSAS